MRRPMSFSVDVHDAPALAPPDFASLAGRVMLSRPTALVLECTGSGFDVKDALRVVSSPHESTAFCGACRGTRTRAVYLGHFHDTAESRVVVEPRCEDCGKFTVHLYERL